MNKQYDYIIIGAGTAGCVLANRLSANPRNRVCLLEAGPMDNSVFISCPMGIVAANQSRKINWLFNTPPQTTQHSREIFCPRGKVVGGSSSVNAMLYIRGNRWDYDHWASLGNRGWSYADVLPFFKATEHQERGADDFHGVGGGQNVADSRSMHPLGAKFLAACESMKYRRNPDFNGSEQEGVGYYQATQINGERCSAARGFLHPILARENLTLIHSARVRRVLLRGNVATGVELRIDGKNDLIRLSADREVILSGGTFNSPQLLMLSGIGPAAELIRNGIEVKHDLAGVGRNLQEHVDIISVVRSRRSGPFSAHPFDLPYALKELMRYMANRRGFLTSSVVETGGFIKSNPSLAVPDLQLQFIPMAMDDHGRNLGFMFMRGLSLHNCLLRPKSRGTVTLNSSNPEDNPRINLNLLSHTDDLSTMIRAVRINREILRQPTLAPWNDEEIFPRKEVESDDQIADFLREKANHVYHPVGTCKMGSDDLAVVDERLRVRGIRGLRVVDASIMPTLIGGNTNAPVLMIGAKGADMILEENLKLDRRLETSP